MGCRFLSGGRIVDPQGEAVLLRDWDRDEGMPGEQVSGSRQ